MENYWHIFGIGPWDVYPMEPPLVRVYEYHGWPAHSRSKLALTQVGPLQLELVEHLEGDTVFRDALLGHGQGLHHFNFLVEDVDEAVKFFCDSGCPCVQRARYGDNGVYAYIDAKPLHTILEPVRIPDNRGMKPIRYPSES